MILKNFKPYLGEHCETTALGALLSHAGLDFSEPMLFGLGQGLGFIYWDSKAMDFPFIGGRAKPDVITLNFCRALGIPLQVQQTTSPRKAWEHAASALESGRPIGLKLDCFYLDYFKNKVHFAAHYLALFGYDETQAFVNDTRQQGPLAKTSLTSLAEARKARGPMSSPNLSFTLNPPKKLPDFNDCLKTAIQENARSFIHPPIQNLGCKGILKMSRMATTWFTRAKNRQKDFSLCAALMERGGTGGSLFRKLYAAFLAEAAERTGTAVYARAADAYRSIALDWTQAAQWIKEAGQSGNPAKLEALARLLADIAQREASVMETLAS